MNWQLQRKTCVSVKHLSEFVFLLTFFTKRCLGSVAEVVKTLREQRKRVDGLLIDRFS